MTERGHLITEIAARLGVSGYSLCLWIKRHVKPVEQRQQEADLQAKNRRLKPELKRASEERDIWKNHRVLRQSVRLRYAFIHVHADQYPVRRLCCITAVHPSGYYAWRRNTLLSKRKTINDGWDLSSMPGSKTAASSAIARSTRTTEKPVKPAVSTASRLMRRERLRSQTRYQRRPGVYGVKPALVTPNRLDRRFDVIAPNVA